MRGDLNHLYQEVVMDHHARPRNFRRLEEASQKAEGYNPFCGDLVTVFLKLEDGVVADVGFQGAGCAISRATASLMTESVKGKTREEAMRLFNAFHRMLTGTPNNDAGQEDLGDLSVLAGVAEFPIRIKCAMLSWHTLRAALEGSKTAVSSE